MQNDRLEAALREKDEEIARIRQQNSEEFSRLVAELRELRTNYEVKIKEYEELMDIKIQLDQEIATYRALLQEEENRYTDSVSLDYYSFFSYSVCDYFCLSHPLSVSKVEHDPHSTP